MARKSKKKPNKNSQTTRFERAYFDARVPYSYGGKTAFMKAIPIKDRKAAGDWLEAQDSYSIHKPFQSKFRRRKIIANFQEQIQVDLIDLSNIASHNDKHKYLLTSIDVFSKKAFVQPIKSKYSSVVADAFEKILGSLGFKPISVHSDQGKEFVGAPFQALLKRKKN